MHAPPNDQRGIPLALIERLSKPTELDTGGYGGGRWIGMQPFVVEMDARPLLTLIEGALQGLRVYELMTIGRPGDVLNYLRVRPIAVHEEISRLFAKTEYEEWTIRACGDGYLPFTQFDGAFRLEGDDTTPQSSSWLAFRATPLWAETMQELVSIVADIQHRLRETGDFLTQREIGCIDSSRHRRDFFHRIERRCLAHWRQDPTQTVGAALLPVLQELLTRPTVHSVSCPLTNLDLWRCLAEEQIQRAERTGRSRQAAFTLSGPDSGLVAPYEDWGADVNIPYEGACGADLFIKPDWRRTFPEVDARGGSLSDIVFGGESVPEIGYVCHYLLTQDDLGPLRCASRREVGDGWVLYESNRPYIRNPLGESWGAMD